MTNLLTRVWAQIVPVIGMIAFFALFILGLIIAIHVLMIVAAIGLVLFAIGYFRMKYLMRKAQHQHNQQESHQEAASAGRTIDHDEIK